MTQLRYTPRRCQSPVTYWVHRPVAGGEAEAQLEPPLPPAMVGRGYPNLVVTLFGTELHFASAAEVRHVIAVLAQKHLPTTRALSAERHPQAGPNRHWLSRLPASLKPWGRRQRIVRVLERALAEVARSGVRF